MKDCREEKGAFVYTKAVNAMTRLRPERILSARVQEEIPVFEEMGLQKNMGG